MATSAKQMPKGKKVWYKDPMILGVAGVGGLAGLYVLAKNRGRGAGGGGGGTPVDTSSVGAIPGAPYSSLGTDFYNAIQDSTSSLQDKLSGLSQSVQDTNLTISKLPTQPTPGPIGIPLSEQQARALARRAKVLFYKPTLKGAKGGGLQVLKGGAGTIYRDPNTGKLYLT